LGVLESLVERGWRPLKLFTTTVDSRLHHNSAVIEFARRLGVEVQISRLTDEICATWVSAAARPWWSPAIAGVSVIGDRI